MALKLRLNTKNINNGTRIVIIPRKYAKYGDIVILNMIKFKTLDCKFEIRILLFEKGKNVSRYISPISLLGTFSNTSTCRWYNFDQR